ncbi:MAG: hypothetical protein Q9190_002650 [Brigantiaea leucoxantha]
MRFFKTLPILEYLVGTALANELTCGSVSTVTVTITPSTVTETSGLQGEYLDRVLTKTGPAATLSSTIYITLTEVFSISHAIPTSVSAGEGPYYFVVHDGSTLWLNGKTPTAGAQLVTTSTVVTLQPVPDAQTSSLVDKPSTSTVTLSSTSFYTEVGTEILTLASVPSIESPTRTYSPLNSKGWNVSSTTLQTLPSPTKTATRGTVLYAGSSTGSKLPTLSTDSSLGRNPKKLWPRQLGAVVTATIEGQIVTWINSYSGEHQIVPATTSKFDDLPHFSTFAGNTDVPPIFSPYRKLFFSGGYGYVPPPSDPYPPISPPQLAVFTSYGNISSSSTDSGPELDGEIGAGPRASDNAYWVDAFSAWIGCANGGPSKCQINILGYDALDTRIASQSVTQPPCPGLENCTLSQIYFTAQFRELAGIQIEAFVDEKPVTFYMDNLNLGWSNNSCAAQLERSSTE